MTPPTAPVAELVSGPLRFRLQETGGRHRFVTDIVDEGRRWPAASIPNAVAGGGLDLAADSVELDGAGFRLSGRGLARGPDGEAAPYDWSAAVAPCPGGGVSFEAVVDLAAPLADPPAIELWLGPLSTVADRQTLTWRRTFVGGPVANTQGLAGNAVPAACLHDPATGIETTIHVDAGAIGWAPHRLLDLEMRELFDHGAARYGLGLVPSRPFVVPPGRHVVRWRLWQRRVAEQPDGWQMSRRIVDVLAESLDGASPGASGASTWERVAAGVVEDLLDADQVQVLVRDGSDEVLGLRAYVRDAAGYYEPTPDRFELMTVADVVPPLLLYLRLHRHEAAATLAARLRESLRRFHRPEAHYISNRFPTTGVEPVTDTWYFFLNGLIKLPWVALIEGDDALGRIALDGLDGGSALAIATEGRLPLFAGFRAGGAQPLGAAPNPSVAGLLAYAALLADELGGSGGTHLARRLLVGLRQEPVRLAFHEPLQLGFAAAAAARLADGGNPTMGALVDEFVHAQLRQLYWDEDPEAERSGYRVRGMFEACASLLYPALKENVEAILPWTVLLRSGRGPTELLLKLMNLIRVHSLAFFDPLLPDPRGGAAPWIPYENLGTTELPGTGLIGREVYGAGEALWAYLLFEGLARADDRAVLVVSADLLDPSALRSFPPSRRRFLVYNPTTDTSSFRLAFRALTADRYRVSTRAGVVDRGALLKGLPLTLPGRAIKTIDIEEALA